MQRKTWYSILGLDAKPLSTKLVMLKCTYVIYECSLNKKVLRERGMASIPKMEHQVFLCIFQKNSAMATYGLKEMGKFLWEGREKGV